jgi:hypothetical protein
MRFVAVELTTRCGKTQDQQQASQESFGVASHGALSVLVLQSIADDNSH